METTTLTSNKDLTCHSCGDAPDPTEKETSGLFEEDGETKYGCGRCWLKENLDV